MFILPKNFTQEKVLTVILAYLDLDRTKPMIDGAIEMFLS